MYRVSIELYKHEWKFGRTRDAVGTRAAGLNNNSNNVQHARAHLLGSALLLLN